MPHESIFEIIDAHAHALDTAIKMEGAAAELETAANQVAEMFFESARPAPDDVADARHRMGDAMYSAAYKLGEVREAFAQAAGYTAIASNAACKAGAECQAAGS